MSDPKFAPALSKNFLIMLIGPTCRSIIASVSYCEGKDLEIYENKKWKIRHLCSRDYEVIDKLTQVRYLVCGYREAGAWPTHPTNWSVYKKKEIKDK